MDKEPKSTPAGRFLLAFEMADFGIALMRENLRKRFPHQSQAEIARRMAEWLEGPDPRGDGFREIQWPR